jgi:RND superfamily putative drug exporter
MFAKFARFISRYWIAVLAAWVVIPALLYHFAPKWDKITHDGDFAYLPSRLPSVRGGELLEKAFPDLASKSTVVLVVARADGELTDEDKAVALRLADDFAPKPGTPIATVMTHKDPFVGSKLQSPDGQSVLVLLQLNNEFMAVDNMKFIEDIYSKVREVREEARFPAGLELGVTGSAAVGSDMLWSMKESIDNTELTTILLVTAILLIVYRSPGLVLVPLVSIGVSFFASMHVIALVALWAERHQDNLARIGHWLGREQFDFQIFKTTQIFIVVVLFGAATDYCLFLIARYREELEHGLEPRAALEEALGQTGHALTASAMTTILGLGAMIFADFGKYRSGGPTIAISLIVALLACMTVAPALLRAFGRAVFWPFGVGKAAGATHAVSGPAEKLPSPSGRGAGAEKLPSPSGRGAGAEKLPSPSGRGAGGEGAPAPGLMGRFWNRMAGAIVARPGLILVGSFLVLALPAFYGFNVPVGFRQDGQVVWLKDLPALRRFDVPITYDMLAELNPQRESVRGTRLLVKHFLIGETGPITILANRRGGNFDTSEQYANISALTEELANFEYVDSAGKKTRPIRGVSSLTNPLGEELTQRKLKLWQKGRLSAREIFNRNNILKKSRKYFLSGGEIAGEVARFELVCDYDPFSPESLRLLGALDERFKQKNEAADSGWHDVEFDYVGVTAGIRDLDAVNQGDTFWVGVYVALAVLIVLIFLLRRPLVSLYLIFTVVFGYLVSLGLTHLFFSGLYGGTYQGLDWKLKMFLFVILVAVGEDYNIYLVTRVVEEQRRRGLLAGLREAVVRTGGIITSCGVIMAGTFGSMATGTLRSMIELGFAMSLGVLLDTFVIRTILVPAFLALLAHWGVQSAAESRGDAAAPHFDAAREKLMQTTKS